MKVTSPQPEHYRPTIAIMHAPGGTDRDKKADGLEQDSTAEADSDIRMIAVPAMVAALLADSPPEINEKKEQTTGIEIRLPLSGKRWKEISARTGLKTTAEMRVALQRIAKEENLDIVMVNDDENMVMTIRLSRKPDYPYKKPVGEENIALINCFDFETF